MGRFVLIVVVLAGLFISVTASFAATTPALVPGAQTEAVQTTEQPLVNEPQSPRSQSQPASQLNEANQTSSKSIDVSGGIPLVTTEQAVGKANKIINEVYSLASKVAPNITIIVLVIAGVLAFAFKEARKMLFYAVLGLMIVLWAIPVVGYIVYLANV
jgi:hypothetical protein